MPTLDLNAQTIAGAKCQNSDRDFFWDSNLPGFALQVTASGHKSFIVQYRANGVSRRMKLKGSTFKAAKKEAKIILGQVQTGTDPLAALRKERDARADTLRRIVEDEYFTNKSVKKLRSFAAEKRGTFRRYIFPALGSRPLAEIKRREIVRMLDRVAATNGPAAAMLSAFCLPSSIGTRPATTISGPRLSKARSSQKRATAPAP
jgi:hypothetical protein